MCLYDCVGGRGVCECVCMRQSKTSERERKCVCVDLTVVTDIIIYNYTDIILDPIHVYYICIMTMRYQFLSKRLYIYIYALFI